MRSILMKKRDPLKSKTDFDLKRKSMQMCSVCITDSSLKLIPFSGCEFHAFLQRHGLCSNGLDVPKDVSERAPALS